MVLRGPTVMAAYLDNPEANREAFDGAGGLAPETSAGWTRMAFCFLAGRRKELINRGAQKIFPQEVDDALMRHPAIADAATFAVPHRSLGEDVAACAVLRKGGRVSERELRKFSSERLAPLKFPAASFSSPEFQRQVQESPNDWNLPGDSVRDWRGRDASRPARGLHASRLRLEALLLTIWAGVLGIERARIDDDFFDLGGDSLSMAVMLSRVFDSVGRGQEQFVQAEFLDRPTVASLAQIFSSRPEALLVSPLPNPTVVFRSGGGRTPFFLFCNSLSEAYHLRHLARSLGPDQPFTAFCPPEPVRGNSLLTGRNMAEESRNSIKAVRPFRPYILGAYCGAAPLAYETALQLMAEGEEVPLLMLFDAPAPGYPKIRTHAKAYLTHAAKILRGAGRTSLPDVLEHAGMLVKLASRRRRGKALRARVSSGAGDSGESILPSLTVCEEYVLRPFPCRLFTSLPGTYG